MSEREKKNFKFGAAEGRVVIVHRCAENSMTRRPSLPSFSYIQSGTSTLLTGDAVTNASGVKGLNQVKSHWFKRCKLSTELPFKYYSYLKIDPCWSSRLILQKWVLDFFFFSLLLKTVGNFLFLLWLCVWTYLHLQHISLLSETMFHQPFLSIEVQSGEKQWHGKTVLLLNSC